MIRRTLVILAALVTASLTTSCATGLFRAGPSESREAAIAACVESVPADTVPFADAFASCMEGYGWTQR